MDEMSPDDPFLSAGGTIQLMTGRVGGNDPTPLRRSMIQFNLSEIPQGALIESVVLNLYLFKVKSDQPANTTLQRITTGWVAGSYNSGSSGHSSGSNEGDATWMHSSNPTPWQTPGGDFQAEISGSTTVSLPGFYTWTDPAMIADVQGWVDGAFANNGWMLRGDEESSSSTAKEFASMEYWEEDYVPALVVTYIPVPEPASAMTGEALLAAGLLSRRRRFASIVQE